MFFYPGLTPASEELKKMQGEGGEVEAIPDNGNANSDSGSEEHYEKLDRDDDLD